jgi:hypothetical protein
VDDALWGELTESFSPSELVELAISVAQNLAMGKVMALLRVPNPSFRGHPDVD